MHVFQVFPIIFYFFHSLWSEKNRLKSTVQTHSWLNPTPNEEQDWVIDYCKNLKIIIIRKRKTSMQCTEISDMYNVYILFLWQWNNIRKTNLSLFLVRSRFLFLSLSFQHMEPPERPSLKVFHLFYFFWL